MINPFDEVIRSLEISPTPSYSDSEEEINNAYEESIKEKSILPILKQELRFKIQTRRLSEGQEELHTEKTEPNKVYELTEEEKEKYNRRLEQNRQSLRKSRNKEFEHELQLRRTYNTESSKKEMLEKEKQKLLLEKQNLLKKLQNVGVEFNENKSTLTCIKCRWRCPYPP